MKKQKIFVSAYACEPGLGSEIGVGWHWVLEMSKYFELWVLTRKSNQHTIEPWIAEHPEYGNIHFLYFDLPKWARFWKKGLRGVRTYYNIWQWLTNGIVKRTMIENDIHIFHHLTYGNVLWPVSKYGMKQFFIWGPTGGVETIPEEYSCHYPKKMQIVEKVRRAVIGSLGWTRGFKIRCKNADLILCKTEILKDIIPAKDRDKAILFTDVAVDCKILSNKVELADKDKRVEFLTVGRLDPWRGFDITLEAFAKALETNRNMHLTILGKGADKERLLSVIEKFSLQNYVTMVGSVPMDKYYEYMRNADVIVNASLKEGAVTVSFDSMAMGKPLLCIDTTGYTRYFSDEYAIVIKRGDRKSVIDNLSDGMLRLCNNELRYEMGNKAIETGISFSWEKRGEEIYAAISKALKAKSV